MILRDKALVVLSLEVGTYKVRVLVERTQNENSGIMRFSANLYPNVPYTLR